MLGNRNVTIPAQTVIMSILVYIKMPQEHFNCVSSTWIYWLHWHVCHHLVINYLHVLHLRVIPHSRKLLREILCSLWATRESFLCEILVLALEFGIINTSGFITSPFRISSSFELIDHIQSSWQILLNCLLVCMDQPVVVVSFTCTCTHGSIPYIEHTLPVNQPSQKIAIK